MSDISLCWIDDSVEEMYSIMEHVFPAVWDINCSCKTILFGNHYCSRENESGPKDDDRNAFEVELKNFFVVYCQEIDARDWKNLGETYDEKSRLLPSPLVSLVPLQSEEQNGIDQLAKNWMDDSKLEKLKAHLVSIRTGEHIEDDVDDREMSVDILIDAMDIPTGAVVALDICLLYHDFTRIEKGLPSISMALYKCLSENHRCYLYSGLSIARKVLDCWEETYRHLYDGKNNIRIYPKKGLTTKQTITEAKKDLIEILSVENRSENDDKS